MSDQPARDGCLRHLDFLDGAVEQLDQTIARIATVALARKLAVPVWQLLTKPGLCVQAAVTLAEKLRTRELLAGASPRRGHRGHPRVRVTTEQRELDRQLARQAEIACCRLVARLTGSSPPRAKRVRACHRGAHLRALEGQNRAADSKPQHLLFASSVTRTTQNSPKEAVSAQATYFIRSRPGLPGATVLWWLDVGRIPGRSRPGRRRLEEELQLLTDPIGHRDGS